MSGISINAQFRVNNGAPLVENLEKTATPKKIKAEDLDPQNLNQLEDFIKQFDDLKQSLAGNWFCRLIRSSEYNKKLDDMKQKATSVLEDFKPAFEKYRNISQDSNIKEIVAIKENLRTVVNDSTWLFLLGNDNPPVTDSGGISVTSTDTYLQYYLSDVKFSLSLIFSTLLAAIPAVSLFLLGANWLLISAAFLMSIAAASDLLDGLLNKAYKETADNFKVASEELFQGIDKLSSPLLNLSALDYNPADGVSLNLNHFQLDEKEPILYLGPRTEVYFQSTNSDKWVCCWNKTAETISFTYGESVSPSAQAQIEPPWCEALNVKANASLADCNEQFHKKSLELHPDKNPTGDGIQFKVINNLKEAYRTFLSEEFLAGKSLSNIGSVLESTEIKGDGTKNTSRPLLLSDKAFNNVV